MHMLRQWCSQSMLHRPCENMHSGVWLGGLSMPKGWCTLCMSIYFQPWSSPAVGWMKASLNSTNVLFQGICKLLDNATEWEIYIISHVHFEVVTADKVLKISRKVKRNPNTIYSDTARTWKCLFIQTLFKPGKEMLLRNAFSNFKIEVKTCIM